MRYLLLLLLFASCSGNIWHDETMKQLDSIALDLDTINMRASNTLRQLREMNHWLTIAANHSEKEAFYLEKYYATYNEKYYKLYKKHSDSTSYYLTKSTNVK